MGDTDMIAEALQRLVDAKPDPVFTAAFDTLRKGAPGLSESSCAALARSVAVKVAYGPHGKAHKALLEALKGLVALECPITVKDPFGQAVTAHWTEQQAQGHGYAHLYLKALAAIALATEEA